MPWSAHGASDLQPLLVYSELAIARNFLLPPTPATDYLRSALVFDMRSARYILDRQRQRDPVVVRPRAPEVEWLSVSYNSALDIHNVSVHQVSDSSVSQSAGGVFPLSL